MSMYSNNGSEIAIIGMNCRFPGASDVEAYWNNLVQGKETITFFSEEELEEAGVDRSLLQKRNYVKAGSILEDIDQFDASFFGFTPREAEIMDPQQRLFLEKCWEVLEISGYVPEKFDGRIGVYAGVFSSSYLFNVYSNPGLVDSVGELSVRHSNEKDYLATRVSYKLNLKGPSVSVQTSCSTSLVAVHLAVQNLLSGECDMALAGGVSIVVPQKTGYMYQEGSILTPDGHCRPFDSKAEGTIFGSGVGVVALKRLEDAIEDGDTVYAVIKGSAINNDGADKVGFTAPSVNGQAEVIADAMAMADVEPSTVSMIEAHGTGTPLGDPIEISALTRVYREKTSKSQYCAIGSVKSNIGHLGGASGVAGLIKAALSLHHKKIPASLHFEEANPNIDFDNSPFYVNTVLKEWNPVEGDTRRAGVSSFGMGGTNAHVVLEEAPPQIDQNQSESKEQLFVFSAQTDSALETTLDQMKNYMEHHHNAPLRDIANTLQVGRREFAHRAMVFARKNEELLEILGNSGSRKVVRGKANNESQVAFAFSGQGSQYVGMAQGLYDSEPMFRTTFDQCCELLLPELGIDLRTLLYHPENLEEATEQLKQTSLAQPALFAIEYSLTQLLQSWGIKPNFMLGHSIGEYVAATIAGVFTLADALRIVAIRGRLMQSLPAGKMLSVALSETKVKDYLNGTLSLAAVNAPTLSVVAGPEEEVEALHMKLAAQGIETRMLVTSHAFHSSMMDPILDQFALEVSKLALSNPTIPYISNLTGDWIKPEEATDATYWVNHLRETVRFKDGVDILLAKQNMVMLEVGPGQALTALIKQQLNDEMESIAVQLIRHPKDRQSDTSILLQAIGRVWLQGVTVDWNELHGDQQSRRISLPTYPFERKKFWIEHGSANLVAEKTASTRHVYTNVWKKTAPIGPTIASTQEKPLLLVGEVKSTVGQLLHRALKNRKADVLVTEGITPVDAYKQFLVQQGEAPKQMIYVVEDSQEVSHLKELAQQVEQQEIGINTTIYVVTIRMANVIENKNVPQDAFTYAAKIRDLAEQMSKVSIYRLDVQLPEYEFSRNDRLALRWADELITDRNEDVEVAYRGMQRYVHSLEPVTKVAEETQLSDHEGVILIVGEPNSFTLHLAESLSKQGYKHFSFIVSEDSPLEEHSLSDSLQGNDSDIANRLVQSDVNLYLQPGSFTDDLSNLVRQVEERFTTIAGIITSPDTAESAHSTLLSIETWLREYMPEFVWCLTKREKGVTETPRKTEANLDFLTKQLEQEIGISAISVRIDDREWTEGEQAQAVCELIGTTFTQAVLASRKEFAQDIVLMSTDPEETQNQSLNNIPIRLENRDSNNIEQEIKLIWEEVFGIESIGIHDDFFEIGGHSLLAIQLMTRIREHFNIEIELETMFDEPTVAGLVKQVVETLQIGHVQSESQEESIDELELLLQEIEGQSDKEIEKVLNKLNS